MAGTATNLSNYDEVLKTFYLPGIQDYLNHATVLSDILEVNEEDVSGKNATIECHYGRSTGTGAVADGGALPAAGYQQYKKCTVPMKYYYGRIEVTGPTIAATRDDKGAYAKALDSEVRGIVNDAKVEVNRQMFGCGYGILGRWHTSAGSTSYYWQKRYRGNSAGGDAFGSAFGGKYVEKRGDARVVVLASISTNNNATYTIDSSPSSIAVTAVTKGATYDTITCSNPGVTEAAGTFYVRPYGLGAYSASNAGGWRLEMMGLSGIVSNLDLDNIAINNGTYTGLATNDPLQGLDVSTYPWFVAIVDAHESGKYAGQRGLSLILMQTMFDMVEEQAGEDYGPNLMICTRAVRREYLELMQADRRIVNRMDLDGGWDALEYNGIPFVVDNDAIDGVIFFLTTKDLQVYRMSDWDWMQKDGAILSRISGYDTYEAVLFRYAELGVKNRATQGILMDLAYTKSSVEGYSR